MAQRNGQDVGFTGGRPADILVDEETRAELQFNANDAVDYASGDVEFLQPVFLTLSADGTVVVDMHNRNLGTGWGVEVALPFFKGYNPRRVRKVYQSGTTADLTIIAEHNNKQSVLSA